MKLQTLLSTLSQPYEVQGPVDLDIAGLCYDSRQARAGWLFVAVVGTHVDGHEYVAWAAEQGAVAALVKREVAAPTGMTVIRVADSRAALAELAAEFYGNPSRDLLVVGITGTDGKTTTTSLTANLLDEVGLPSGRATTVDFKIGPRVWTNLTRQSTQESLEIQRLLAEMRDAGCRGAVLESTSHALALHRLTRCAYDVAVVTNVASEHLDFHKTHEAYVAAKARIFDLLDSPSKGVRKTAVLNADDGSHGLYQPLVLAKGAIPHLRPGSPEDRDVPVTTPRLLTYGLKRADADVWATDVVPSAGGSAFTLRMGERTFPVRLPLLGLFNVYNALAAATAVWALGAAPEAIAAGLNRARGVPGRMELVEAGQPFTVVVDYAHTPQALAECFGFLKPLTMGRLIAVFGASGERDVTKRPHMGEAAVQGADYAIFTDDDPRFEDREAILEQIAEGARALGWREGEQFQKIADRRAAMAAAFALARPGDIVALCGKGHEECMIVGNEKVPWSDKGVAMELLAGA